MEIARKKKIIVALIFFFIISFFIKCASNSYTDKTLNEIKAIGFEYQLVEDSLTNMKTSWSTNGLLVRVNLVIPKDRYILDYNKRPEKEQSFVQENLKEGYRPMADREVELKPDMSLRGAVVLPGLKLAFRLPKEISHLDLSPLDHIRFYCPSGIKECQFLEYSLDYVPKPLRKCLVYGGLNNVCLLKYLIGDIEKVFITELDNQAMIFWLVSKKGKWLECLVSSPDTSEIICDYLIKSGPLYFEKKGVKIYNRKIYELIPTKLEDNHFLAIIPCIGRTNQCFKRNFYYFSRPSLSQKLPLEFIEFPIYIGEIKSYNFVNNTMRLGLILLLPVTLVADIGQGIVPAITIIPEVIEYLFFVLTCGKKCRLPP